MKKVIVPKLGEGIEEAVVAFWHYSEGSRIEKGDDLVEIAADKATFNVPAEESGVIKRIFRREGETVKIGEVIAELEQ